jgi:thiamine-phosphate pyrophosphorylase
MYSLPRLMLVTQRNRMKPDFFTALNAALRGGARLMQLREKELPGAELFSLAAQAKALCESFGAKLLINHRAEVARQIGAGVHWPEGAFEAGNSFCGVSVHSLEAARRAAGQGADYLVFGSVFETQSHPGAAPAGLDLLREVCSAVEIPVFAIGGITPENAHLCWNAGAHGIAVIGAAWDTNDVESAVRKLVQLCE